MLYNTVLKKSISDNNDDALNMLYSPSSESLSEFLGANRPPQITLSVRRSFRRSVCYDSQLDICLYH